MEGVEQAAVAAGPREAEAAPGLARQPVLLEARHAAEPLEPPVEARLAGLARPQEQPRVEEESTP